MTDHRIEALDRRSQRSSKMCETHLSDRLNDHSATISITDPAALLVLAREAPVSAAREAQIAMRTLRTGFKEHRVGIIGAAYASAYHMMRTDRAWELFIKDPGWDDLSNRPKNTKRARHHMLLHVLRYVFRAEGGNARRRVRVYAGMLQDRFHKGFKPEGVIPLIKSRGIEALRDEGVALRKGIQKGSKDKYFADLNSVDDEDRTPTAPLPKPRWRKLKPAQIGEAIALMNTFNGAMLRYLSEQTEQVKAVRSPDPTGTSREQSCGQPAAPAWRRR
ncbi:hypothetical protein GOFOIKOB_1436 [Methylobacterium tardum]|uniref:Uncharacterized protein n=1 Tax=Methylobacterium tardum TaxID=374432 RepID=A0AA37WW56_9HYPH|nr:hypothetical protein [Methylobacterium tardum]GJE48407.1 hypothetical protein GOFOIKOB_1436 [Methylobacterium tardum]GLS73018.1 hypothetical protein GCM10007890_50330 [Methylobacterium tardum]